jgi:SET domain-containing protein
MECAYIIALRDINADEELYVDYGRWYWVGKKPSRLLYIPKELQQETIV